MLQQRQDDVMRLLIVDDNARFLEAARDRLERDGMTVVGVAANSAEALLCARDLRPDVTLVDLDLGDESGFDLAVSLQIDATATTTSPVILISAYPEEDFQDLIQASPAIGFLPKSKLSSGAISDLVARTIGQNWLP
jgi:DNA-binding NarL/FixJ family response regulator